MASRRGGGRSEDPTVRISKALTYLLRHGAAKEGLPIRPDGFVPVDAILNHRSVKNFNVGLRQLENIVETNDKKRFELRTIDSVLYIKAAQGHTIEQLSDLELTPVTLESAKCYPVVVHGTNFRAWQSIARTGLSKMDRLHIHFAIGAPGASEVISGMRNSATVHIYIDLEAALKDEIPFFISSNKVILSPGIDGVLPPKYFKKVVDVKTGLELPSSSTTPTSTSTSTQSPITYSSRSTSSSSSSSSRSTENQKSSFDYICVLDFEATCDDKVRLEQEIIEFPGVLIDVKQRKIISEHQNYCKPVINPKLTKFCIELTGIQQEWVDKAPLFRDAYQSYEAWLNQNGILNDGEGGPSVVFVTCGDWDLKTMLPSQLRTLKSGSKEDQRLGEGKLPNRYYQWINVKNAFQTFENMRRPPRGMTDMLVTLGLKLEGRHHSGIDDCRNIAKIVLSLLEGGWEPQLTWTARRNNYH